MIDSATNKITLVLGGGSARGLAHIGVLKVLQKAKIPINLIVGTSIGALIGASYALGIPLKRTEALAIKIRWQDLTDFIISKMSFLEGRNLQKIITEVIEGKSFDDLKIPMAVVATDIEKAERVILTSGNLIKAIQASCSLPGIFMPVKLNDKLLVDGGLTDSVPSRTARDLGTGLIIASDVGFCVKKEKITNIFQMIFQSIQIAGDELNKLQDKIADITIAPDLPGDIDQMAFDKADFIIKKGEEAAMHTLPLIQSAIKNSN